MSLLYIALAAFAGALVSGLLGWLESKEPFNPRKFLSTVLRAILAGVVFAVGYTFRDGLSVLDLLYAFLGGAGVDVIGNRAVSRLTGRGAWPL